MNAIFLIIDSLDYTRCQSSKVQLLPNIERRAKNGIVCENMYSQAPYTEAATIALYCGQNTLDYHGYIERFNNAEITLIEAAKNAGYETFYNSFQPQCFPSSLRRGVDYIRYNRGFDNPSLWPYRFEYYSDKYKNGDFSDKDFLQLIRILSDNFNEWIRFLDDLILEDESISMIGDLNKKFDARAVRKCVIEEECLFKNDSKSYIFEIFKEGKKHRLFNIPYFEQIDYEISKYSSQYYNKEIRKLVKKIRVVNAVQNIIFNNDVKVAFIRAFKSRIKGDTISYSQEIALIRNALFMGRNNEKYGKQCHSLKGQPSFNEHIKSFFEWLENRKDKNTPFFATIHVDDIHYPEMFFSYDSDDHKLLSVELTTAKDCLSKRKFNEKGTISLDLSLRYADLKFEQLMKGLEERNLLDDTVIFVTADHGFSYSGYPIRYKFVNTFYLENFKIPFFAIGRNIKKSLVSSLKSSVDIPPTICEILGIEVPDSFVGKSIMNSEDKNRVLTIEYCGGGCPDINDKKLMIAAFDSSFMVAGLFRLEEEFNNNCITEIYDLKNDPLQRNNLKGKINLSSLADYIEVIQNRINTIKYTNKKVLDTF